MNDLISRKTTVDANMALRYTFVSIMATGQDANSVMDACSDMELAVATQPIYTDCSVIDVGEFFMVAPIIDNNEIMLRIYHIVPMTKQSERSPHFSPDLDDLDGSETEMENCTAHIGYAENMLILSNYVQFNS